MPKKRKRIEKLKVDKKAKKVVRRSDSIRSQHIVDVLVDLYISEAKKRYSSSAVYDAITGFADRLGLLQAFNTAYRARPKVRSYGFTRVSEEQVDVYAQSMDEAQNLAIDADSRGLGRTIHLKQRRRPSDD